MALPSREVVVLTFFGGATSVGCFNPSPPGSGDGSSGAATTGGPGGTAPSMTASTTMTSNSSSPSTTSPPTTEPTTTPDTTAGPDTVTETTTGPPDTTSGTTGCPEESTGGGDGVAPVFEGGEFTEASVVTLTFSEALQNPVGTVDPSQFRLSYAIASSFPPAPYDTLVYYDLGYMSGDFIQVEQIGWDPCAKNQVVLYLNGELDDAVCERVEAFNDYYFGGAGPSYETVGGILLHFARGLGGDLEDFEGLAFEDLSPEFVLNADELAYRPPNYYVYADFPERDPDLPIPCP